MLLIRLGDVALPELTYLESDVTMYVLMGTKLNPSPMRNFRCNSSLERSHLVNILCEKVIGRFNSVSVSLNGARPSY